MSQGKIVQIIGAVVDVEFPRADVPKVYDALKVQGTAITLEVQQQLGDGVVRTIALGSTDGLKRNLVAENMASEQSARMVAMKAASDNAKNVSGELQLVYNKTRQAAITKEVSDIVSGAAAV